MTFLCTILNSNVHYSLLFIDKLRVTNRFASKATLTVIPACLESFLKKDAGQASMTEHFRNLTLLMVVLLAIHFFDLSCGNSSVGRAQPCQGWGRGFESRFPLQRHDPGLWAKCLQSRVFFWVTTDGRRRLRPERSHRRIARNPPEKPTRVATEWQRLVHL